MTIDVREIHGEYLRDPEFAALYLNRAIEEGDMASILIAIRCVAEAQEDGFDGLAERLHIKPEAVYNALSNQSILQQIGSS